MHTSRLLLPALALVLARFAQAQPSPEVQARITAAIKAAGHANGSAPLDYAAFVNPFIGTDNFGDVCPGASIPFGMAKFSTDFTGYAPAGYVTDNTQMTHGISPLHDSGTGSSLGSYGNFEVMPVFCDEGFETCPTTIAARERFRKNFTDDATPGYFSQTLDNGIQIEATATRRAGLERFTFPRSGNGLSKSAKPFFVLDLANDLPMSFNGGTMDIDPELGRITIGGLWEPSFGPGTFLYQAFACYDLLDNGRQKLDQYGVWTGDTFGLDAKALGQTHLNLSVNLIGSPPYQSGAFFSFVDPGSSPFNSTSSTSSTTTNSTSSAASTQQFTLRVGVSFVSAVQACANAESEVGTQSFEEVQAAGRAAWNEKLSRVEIDVPNTPENVTEMFYSSLYRSFLTPNNATGETQGAFANTTSPYFDSLYCSWDTFRTFYPLMALHSPTDFADIVENYIDGWRKTGWMPECRSNNLPGWTQGGSDGDNIVSHFAVTYHNEAAELGVNLDDLYSALVTDAEVNPPEWNIHGRQVNVYKQFGYVPFAVFDPASTGRQTREGSRTLEYSFNDFGVRQAALVLNKTADVEKYTNRSLSYRNVWDPSVTSDGFKGFMQKRFSNGTFAFTDPIDCSPQDNSTSRDCSLQSDNEVGFYESSSWEYSFFAPHDTAHLVELMGGNDTFVKRLDHFFSAGYFLAGNEPSFQTPVGYHYAGQPTKSVDQVRAVIFENYDITPAGLPGNDDQAAMATFLAFHLLGMYPVPSTSQLLILSPFTPKYTIHNTFLNTSTTVTVKNFDARSVQHTIPAGVAAYVANVTINGVSAESRCHFDFYDTFRLGGEIEITLTANKEEVNSCGGSLPMSLSTGGFAVAR